MLSFVSFFFSAEYMEGLTFFFTFFCFHTRPLFTHSWIFFFESSPGLNQSTITRRIREKKEVLVCIRMLWAYEISNPSPKARPFVYLFMRISMCNTLSAISLSLFFFFDKRCLSSRSFFFPPRSSSSLESFPTRRIKPHVSDHGAVIAIFFFVGTTLAHRSHLSSSDDEQPERSVVESKGWFKLRSDFQLTARTCSFLIFLYQHYIRVSCLLMEWYIFSIISYLMYRINRLYIRFQ